MEPKDIETFEQKIHVTFSNKGLLQTAFTHRSFVNEHRGVAVEHNERLEFLGDAVLELLVTDFLFRRFPEKTEGDLTAYRAALVNTNTLADVATSLGMNEYLRLSKGEARDQGRARQYILANAFEAVIGALYVDQGYAAAEAFVHNTIAPLLDNIIAKRLFQDAKSRLQEESQERLSVTPTYQLVSEVGPDHDKEFTVGVYLGSDCAAVGKGKSKQEAEQEAATKALIEKGW